MKREIGGGGRGGGVIQEVVMFTEACLYYCIVVSHVTLFATLKGFARELKWTEKKFLGLEDLQKE